MFDTYCTDLIALFANHVFGCDDCFDKTICVLFALFGFFGCLFVLISIVVGFFDKLFSKIFDRFRYKKCYDDLITQFGDLSEEYDKLVDEHSVLLDEHIALQKEYYHTCN